MDLFAGSVWGAFLLTTLAGLATAAGAAAAFFTRRTNTRMLSVALGLSGGVMVYISFVELLAGANLALREELGGRMGAFTALAAFFGGMLVAAIIDRLVPEPVNPHETKSVEDMETGTPADCRKLHRAGIRFAVAIAIHKFPEGLAVFAASLSSAFRSRWRWRCTTSPRGSRFRCRSITPRGAGPRRSGTPV